MMASGSKYKESRVTNYRTETRQLIQYGGALSLTFTPVEQKKVQSEPRVSRVTSLMGHQLRRSAERCSAGDNYKREKFQPSATRDLEKEKRRLQNVLSTGKKDAGPTHSQRDSTERREQQIDRFQEVLDEIEDRRQFLEEMMTLGKGDQYQHLINTEISQKICELEEIDRKRSEELRTLNLNGKEELQSKERDGER
ncbi:UPF0193 protein EVG1 isoform X2 [Rhinichthys klamathensis goyatoka]|uniref:UPF0193 protein EVG1 isoform X2 n=1 Tax=Rhinichthys klamathensis goyatoka TaxID=3034132 RepID=UPI0024B59D53|nr:UPF0193 protein EVG1 isoform X2 [Rhinichthys klamathensis goyatoka]